MKISVSKQNQKEINTLMLAHNGNVTAGNISTPEKTIAENVAWQCPFKGGKAVYDARGIVWKYNPGAKFSDELLCNSGAYFREQAQENSIKDEVNFSLVPNPASNFITLYYAVAGLQKLKIKIVDVTGRWVKEIDVKNSEQKTEINISDLAGGIYMIKLMSGETEKASLKLAVTK